MDNFKVALFRKNKLLFERVVRADSKEEATKQVLDAIPSSTSKKYLSVIVSHSSEY